MVVEELLIRIKSIVDNDGFRKAETSMRNFDNTSKKAMQEASAHAGNFGAGLDKAGGRMDNLVGKIKKMGPAMAASGAAGLAAIGAFYYTAIQAAAGSEQVWGRFTVSIGRTGLEIGKTKKEYAGMVEEIMSSTGRMKGDITNSLADLSRVGVTNKSVLQRSSCVFFPPLRLARHFLDL